MDIAISANSTRVEVSFCRWSARFLAQALCFLACFFISTVALSAAQSSYVSQELFCPIGSPVASLDISCAVQFSDVESDFEQYQVVDTSADNGPALAGSWRISVDSFRFKNFIKGVPLLVVGDAFSKRAIANACSAGQKLGLNLSVAVGTGWPKPIQSVLNSRRLVSAQEVFFEYYLGDVTLVTTSADVSKKMQMMGLENRLLDKDYLGLQDVGLISADAEPGKSSMVIVESALRGVSLSAPKATGVYALDGGIESLGIYYRDMKKTQIGKASAEQNKTMCAAF